MRNFTCALIILGFSSLPVPAADVSGTYTYFPVHGTTLLEIERQLKTHGPRIESTGQRHPGATNMKFTVQVEHTRSGKRCRVTKAHVTVEAEVTLPEWRDRARADQDVRLIWDTLARDIKRHEGSHLIIAKNHARLLEDTLEALPPRADCTRLAQDMERTKAKILAEHDAAQDEFDRIEGINFERRFMRLLQYRMEQIEAGRLRP